MGEYILMNKDTKIGKIEVIDENIKLVESYINIPKYIKESWLNNRLSIYSRKNIMLMAKMAGIENKDDFLSIAKAVSVTDTVWVKGVNDNINWSKINPYKNKLSSVMANIALDGNIDSLNVNFKSPSPQYKIDGITDKCIKRCNGELLLYKTAGEKWSDLAGCRPYSEYYAAYIANKLGISKYTKYYIKEKITENRKIKPYSICKLFTNESKGLIQIGDTILGNMSIESLYRRLNKEMQRNMREMIVLDSIILNCDRHKGNYGFIINNNTFEIESMAPIYDNDCSLGSLVSIQYKNIEEAFEETKRKLSIIGIGTYDDMARWGMTKYILNRLKSVGYIRLERKFKGLSEKRMRFMEYIVNRRIKEIIELFE